jgi:hypothetical protein
MAGLVAALQVCGAAACKSAAGISLCSFYAIRGATNELALLHTYDAHLNDQDNLHFPNYLGASTDSCLKTALEFYRLLHSKGLAVPDHLTSYLSV